MGKIKFTTTIDAVREVLRESLAITPQTTLKGRDDKAPPPTVPTELPVSPSDHAATQLSTQKPPVEDPEFIPANQVELGKSLDSLSQLVPDDAIEKFYREFVKMIDRYVAEKDDLEFGD